MYYLNSRYYHPEYHRFNSADGVLGANGDILSYNLFTYCSNNPVIFSDPTGTYKTNNWLEAFLLALAEVLSDPKIQISILINLGQSYLSKELRICTDGATSAYGSTSHQTETAFSGRFHISTPANEIPYIVIPMNQNGYNDLIGCIGVVIDNKTGRYVYAIIGDGGPSKNGFGEVSLKVAWELGYSNSTGANGPEGDFTIVIYPGTRQAWMSVGLYEQIQLAGQGLFSL